MFLLFALCEENILLHDGNSLQFFEKYNVYLCVKRRRIAWIAKDSFGVISIECFW